MVAESSLALHFVVAFLSGYLLSPPLLVGFEPIKSSHLLLLLDGGSSKMVLLLACSLCAALSSALEYTLGRCFAKRPMFVFWLVLLCPSPRRKRITPSEMTPDIFLVPGVNFGVLIRRPTLPRSSRQIFLKQRERCAPFCNHREQRVCAANLAITVNRTTSQRGDLSRDNKRAHTFVSKRGCLFEMFVHELLQMFLSP